MLKVDIEGQRGAFSLVAQLDVPSGVTALLGRSGAGKSSLLRYIAGLETPSAGRIALGKTVFYDQSQTLAMRAENRQVGMVFQRPALLPHLGVMGNIRLGARGAEISQDMLVRTGCAPLISRPISALSGGERQRVMLARALSGRPKLLLLDEPLSALDPHARNELMALFADILPTLDVPVLYVTHGVDEAGRVADRFALMQEGRLVVAGGASNVLGHYGVLEGGGLSTLLSGDVVEIADDGLAVVAVEGQKLEVPRAGLVVGAPVRLRVWARDVVLALNRPSGLSARNMLSGNISALTDVPGGQIELQISIGDQILSALVMHRTAVEMGLCVDREIIALFKSASVEPMGRRVP